MVSPTTKRSKNQKSLSVRPSRRELRERTLSLLQKEIEFIDNPEFRNADHLTMRREVSDLLGRLDAPPEVTTTKISMAPPFMGLCSQPLLQRDDEREVFRTMNFFKFRANSLRSSLDPLRPSIRKIREIEKCLQTSNQLRNHAERANTRLVVSIVKSFVKDQNDFDELLSEGLACLLRVVEKFDYGRGFRFSTYATWSIKNCMFRVRERSQRQAERFRTGMEGVSLEDSRTEVDLQIAAVVEGETSSILQAAMQVLNDRERLVIESRCGFRILDIKPTLKNLGELLGVCKERVRQIERKGMDKIRAQFEEMNIDLERWQD